MEAQYSAPMGQSPFFYYNPDPHPEHRQHGHFTPHPHQGPQQFHGRSPFYPEMMKPVPSQTFPYVQSQHALPTPPAMAYPQQSYMPMMPTPVASPQPIYHAQRSALLQQHQQHQSPMLKPIDTSCGPATPPLSHSGSTASSPPSSTSFLPTPVNGSFGDSLIGVKQGCEGDVFSEILAASDMSRSQSPPLTPGTCSAAEARSEPRQINPCASLRLPRLGRTQAREHASSHPLPVPFTLPLAIANARLGHLRRA